jgi:Domain of unknown function (DUF4397)
VTLKRRTDGPTAAARRRLALIGGIAVGLMTMLLAASPGVASADNSGKLRMGYFSSDAPAVDFYLDGQKAWSDIGYKTVSQYINVTAGNHTITVRTAGQPNSTPVAEGQQAIDANSFFTGIAAGKINQQKVAFYQDSLSTPPAGKSMVRFVHLAPEVPGVDVKVVNGPTLFTNIGFLGGSQYATVDAGTYNLALYPTGASTPTLFTANGVEVPPGVVATAIGSGGVGVPVELVKVLDAASAPTTPQGGAATGGGGLALRQAAGVAPVLIGLVMAALLLGLTRRRAAL